jgi:hypothetical protein
VPDVAQRSDFEVAAEAATAETDAPFPSVASDLPTPLPAELARESAAQSSLDESRRAVRLAFYKALAAGIRRHLPDALGAFLKLIPVCAAGAFARLVLGSPGWSLGLGVSATVVAISALPLVLRALRVNERP